MRLGFLGRPESATAAAQQQPPQHMRPLNPQQQHHGNMTPTDFHMASPSHFAQHSPSKMQQQLQQQQQQPGASGQFSWQGGEMGMMKDGVHMPIETKAQQPEDVEVMSTDSSSSSSTDSN